MFIHSAAPVKNYLARVRLPGTRPRAPPFARA